MCTEWQSTVIAKMILKSRIKWGHSSTQLWHLHVLCLWTAAPRLLCPWGFSRQGYWRGSSGALLRDLPDPGIEQRSPTLQADSLQSEPPGKPRILEWVAYPFSRGSSQPRDQTQVSHISGRFFTSWVTREAKNTGVGSLSLLQQIFPTQE